MTGKQRWIPRIGEHVVIKGDGDKTRTTSGVVEAVSKRGCAVGVVKVRLAGYREPFIAEDSQIVILESGRPVTSNLGRPPCQHSRTRAPGGARIPKNWCDRCHCWFLPSPTKRLTTSDRKSAAAGDDTK